MLYLIPLSYPQIFITFLGFNIFLIISIIIIVIIIVIIWMYQVLI